MFVLRFLVWLARLLFVPFFAIRWAVRPKGTWIGVEIDGSVVDFERPRKAWSFRVTRAVSLFELGEFAGAACADSRVVGVVVTLRSLQAGMANATSLRNVLERLRKAGKHVVVHLPLGADTKELYVASAASKIYAGPQCTLAPLGFATHVRYLKGTFGKAGVEPTVIAKGAYKSAGEPLVRDSMSDEQREQLSAIQDVFYSQFMLALADGRRLGREQVQAIVDNAPHRVPQAVELGLIDGGAYEDELSLRLKEALAGSPSGSDGSKPTRTMPWRRYMRARRLAGVPRLFRRPVIGVIPVHGTITAHAPLMVSGATDENLISQIRVARASRRIRGVVLHVDSPGGSALASDRIHHELSQLAQEKPVVACFANVAASGGYYVAAPAHAIVAQPTTLTGSIGVVSARFAFEPLLARLGVVTESVRRGARAGMLDSAHALTNDERAALEKEIEAIYQAFLGVVAAGRKQPMEAVERVAGGRVWTGAEAVSKKLVDALGGFEKAVDMTRTLLGYDQAAEYPPMVVEARRQVPALEPPRIQPAVLLDLLAGADLGPLTLAAGRERALLWSAVGSLFRSME